MSSTAEISVALLVGGLGTRLRSAVPNKPKVVAEVAGSPFITKIFDQLLQQGCTEVVLCTGYLSDQIRQLFGSSYRGLSVSYSEEKTPLGTAGALALAKPLLKSNLTLVMNGDSFAEFDLQTYLAHFEERSFEGGLLLTPIADASRYGKVVLGENEKILSFREKGHPGPGLINAGAYLLRKNLLEEIPEGVPCSLEHEMFPRWVARGALWGYASEGQFIDIGTPESYDDAKRMFSKEPHEI